MKRPRPHIPLSVRCKVAERQLVQAGIWNANHLALLARSPTPALTRLAFYLELLFGSSPCALDHNPALILRSYNPRIKNVAARYSPNANNPDFLIYRTKHEHHIKTNVRGEGAHRSDTSQRVYLRRIERNKAKRAAKAKDKTPAKYSRKYSRPIPKRVKPWGEKGSRPFQSRPPR